jgi:uncharacterized membrane protein
VLISFGLSHCSHFFCIRAALYVPKSKSQGLWRLYNEGGRLQINMAASVFWILFFFGFPILVLWACSKYVLLDAIGGVVICYAFGIIIGNLGIFPENMFTIQDLMTTLTIPVALPLIFFSMRLADWRNQTALVLKGFFGALAAVIIGSFVTFFIMRGRIGADAWKVAGMLIGVYTGGTPNMAAIGTALKVETTQYIAVHASDVVISGFLLLLILSILPRLIRKFLPVDASHIHKERIKDHDTNAVYGQKEFTPYFSGFTRKQFVPLVRAFVFSLIIFAIGGGLSLVVPDWISSVVAIIVVTTLGVAGSFSKHIRESRFTFQLGYYFLLVFSLVVSSMANIRQLTETAPVMMTYVGLLLGISFILHMLFSKLLRVDGDTQLITATAMIFSPPFVPVVAASLKNRDVIVTGMVSGIAGWVLGNYIGIGFAYLVRLL